MKRIIYIVVFIVIMLFSNQAVFALTCVMSDDPLENFKNADAVFVGKVISKKDKMDMRHEIQIDGGYFITLEIIQAFKGWDHPKIVVHTDKEGWAWGYPFVEGETYLIYAYKQPAIENHKGLGGGLSVSKCSRTRPLAEAGEDIKIIKRYLGE